ncbi:hypothetical protein P9B03_01965 [Metasolibacillus meyeri]|uniref:Uncharacterized protein n=1 Tax=Metasolibacillus meyeri TaxID=1071052 RepID=A0AAW9NR25_9BACL|nr:hypothetical protein [Metasolibacillus meyeri]MEC1177236.1 hypothetical protein [Metasolibacillus meyeri]
MIVKSHKFLKYVIFFLCFTILVVVLYNIYKINESDIILSNIKQEVQQNDYVDFSKVVEGDWDNIILVTPYTDKAKIKNNYGIAVNRISDFSIAYRDDSVLIIFCKGESIQNYIYWLGSVSSSEDEKLYDSLQIKREDAQFKTSNNNVFLNLIHVKE